MYLLDYCYKNSTKGADASGEFQLAASILFIYMLWQYSELMQTEAKQVLINPTTFNQQAHEWDNSNMHGSI